MELTYEDDGYSAGGYESRRTEIMVVEDVDGAVSDAAQAASAANAAAQSADSAAGRIDSAIAGIPSAVEDAAKEFVSYRSASKSPIAQFSTNAISAIYPKAYIEAMQSGSGTPSPDNVRNIVGWDEVNVKLSGSDTSVVKSITNISLPSTCYGGYVDWKARELVVTHRFLQFDGTEQWAFYSVGNGLSLHRFAISGAEANTIVADSHDVICFSNMYQATYMSARQDKTIYAAKCQVDVIDNSYSSVAEWKAHLAQLSSANTPLQAYYELATPLHYPLDLPEIQSLIGTNNVWCDSGEIEVEAVNTWGMLASRSYVEEIAVTGLNYADVIVPQTTLNANYTLDVKRKCWLIITGSNFRIVGPEVCSKGGMSTTVLPFVSHASYLIGRKNTSEAMDATITVYGML